jgi:hypothetical protein
MQLILPDVLTAARGLSPGAAGFLLLVGVLLWAVGWRWHRFWIVFGITLAAGLIGLSAGQAAGGQVMVVGVLLAVAAGMLALELAKILAFVTGGAAAWAAVQTVFPQVHELWAVFLSGGLVGVVLYQLWTMMTTSLVGVLVAWHAGFVLAEQFARGFDASKWADEHSAALNGGVVVAAVLGILAQRMTAPRPAAESSEDEGEPKEKNPRKKPAAEDDDEPAKKPRGWWDRMLPGRKAA